MASPKILAHLHRLTRGGGLRAQLLRGGIGGVAVKVGGLSLTIAVTIVLARALGPEGYGVYAYVFAIINVLAIPAMFGLPQLVVRETAKAQAHADWPTIKGLWAWSGLAVGGVSFLLVTIGVVVAWFWAERLSDLQLSTLAWGLVLVPGLVMGRLVGAGLRGLRHVVAGQFPDIVLRPGLLLALVLAMFLVGMGEALTASRAMALHALAAGLAFLAGAALLWRLRPVEVRRETKASYQHRAWGASALPLGFIAGMQLINNQADILMLGLFTNAEQVGIYRVAVQGATLGSFGLQVVNMVIAPQIARLHAQRRTAQLQRLATAGARTAFAIAFPAVVVFAIFGADLLRAVVGEDYVAGMGPLTILAVGQMVNAAMGSVGVLLSMTGYEQVVARGVAVAAVVNIVANLLLIPIWGMNGAASATALTFMVWNVLLAWAVAKRLGISSAAFGAMRILK